MAYDIVFTQRFEEDLGNAVGYLKNNLHSPASAARLTKGIRKAADDLAEFPHISAISSKPGLSGGEYREFLVGGYAIIYRVERRRVLLLRLFHQSQLITGDKLEDG